MNVKYKLTFEQPVKVKIKRKTSNINDLVLGVFLIVGVIIISVLLFKFIMINKEIDRNIYQTELNIRALEKMR